MEHFLLDEDTIKVVLPEKVDADNYNAVQKDLEDILAENPNHNLQLDASKLSYLSSAGLRVFLKIQKQGKLESLVNVCKEVYDILDITGFDAVLNIVKSLEQEDISEDINLGEDAYGYLYKKDEDTVIKIFKCWVSLDEIKTGRRYSEMAMNSILSNALTYDTVQTDKGIGCLYAVDEVDTVENKAQKDPSAVFHMMKELIKQLDVLHEVTAFDGALVKETDRLCELVDLRLGDFSLDEKNIIKRCIKMLSRNNYPIMEMIDSRTLIYSAGTVLFTDLSLLRYGNSVFELAGLYRNILEHSSFLGAINDDAIVRWKKFIADYADTWDDNVIELYDRVCSAFANLLCLLCNDPQLNSGISDNYKKNVRERFIRGQEELRAQIMGVKHHQEYGAMDNKDYLHIDIEERTVIKAFRKKKLLKDIKLDIFPGEMVLLMGGSGAGKTTFLNAVTGYEKAKAKITLGSMDVYREYDYIKHKLAFAPQQDLLRDDDTVYNTLRNAADMRLPVEVSKEDKEKEIQRMLDIFGLADLKNSSISSLSGGQRKRCSIAVEFISNPILFFLDEPDSGLDGVMARSLMEDLRKITGDDKMIVVISHAPDRVIDLFDKLIVLAKSNEDGAGHLAFYGSPKEAREFFERDTMEEILRVVNRANEGGEGRSDECIAKFNDWR